MASAEIDDEDSNMVQGPGPECNVEDASDEEEEEVKPWDRYFQKPPPELKPEKIADGWGDP